MFLELIASFLPLLGFFWNCNKFFPDSLRNCTTLLNIVFLWVVLISPELSLLDYPLHDSVDSSDQLQLNADKERSLEGPNHGERTSIDPMLSEEQLRKKHAVRLILHMACSVTSKWVHVRRAYLLQLSKTGCFLLKFEELSLKETWAWGDGSAGKVLKDLILNPSTHFQKSWAWWYMTIAPALEAEGHCE